MTLSFAVTAFNEMSEGRLRGQRILDCIRHAQEHPAVDEIVVVDDGSADFPKLLKLLGDQPKVTLHHNAENLGVFGNKIEAVLSCRGDWVITCDSDNVMDGAFIDKVVHPRYPDTWYCPSFARTHFDYRELVGSYTLTSIDSMFEKPIGNCCINTGNQTVHRGSFMEVFGQYRGRRADLMLPNWLGLSEEQRKQHYWRLVFDACDSLLLNMLWLYAGNVLFVMDGLEYDHYYASGPEGNYTRSPVEKGKLGEILLEELRTKSREARG